MSLAPLIGHEKLRNRLEGALASGRFPQSALFVGPAGVGKQRLGLWVAQGLLCAEGPGAPCGACQPCKLVSGLAHPDLHWFTPIPRPKAGNPDRQVDQAEETLAEIMADRRSNPFYARPDGMSSHALASVRLLQRRVSLKPFQANRKIILLGDAERLVVQEASQEAANALLKVLEEPPRDTVILLTAAEPRALLPTIQSRLVPIRVGRLTDAEVRAFLTETVDPPLDRDELERRVLGADGCPGLALAAAGDGDGADRTAASLLNALRRGSGAWAPLAFAQQPWGARGDFSAMLDSLALKLRASVKTQAAGSERSIRRRLLALRRVQQIRAEAQGNTNPQLALATLASDLERLS